MDLLPVGAALVADEDIVDAIADVQALQGQGEGFAFLRNQYLIAGGHGRAQGGVAALHGDDDLEDLGVGIGALFADIGDLGDGADELLARDGIEADGDGLAGLNLADIDLIDVGERLHLAEVRQGRHDRIPGADHGPGGTATAVPLAEVDQHTLGGGVDGELLLQLAQLAVAVTLLVQVRLDLLDLGDGLGDALLIVGQGLLVGPLGLLVLQAHPLPGGGSLVDGLLEFILLLLHGVAQVGDIVAGFGEAEGGIEHRLLVLRLGLLEGELLLGELGHELAPVQLGDKIARLHLLALGGEALDLHLVDAGPPAPAGTVDLD